MRPGQADPRARPLIVQHRRRPFGLDAPRPLDVGRIERDILAWLANQVPYALPLRAGPVHDAAEPKGAAHSSTLVLLLPCRRVAVLRIEARPGRLELSALLLAQQCHRRNIPLAVVTNLAEARAALRRWGCEPERS